MKGKRKQVELRFIALIIILTITIVFSFFYYIINDNRNLTLIEGTIKDVIISFQKYILVPSWKKGDTGVAENKSDYNLVITENEELKREINSMKGLLELNNTLVEYKVINATVINRDITGWFNTLTIDKGYKHGIKNDMVVVIDEGLVGRTIKTTNYTSVIKLLTSAELINKISAAIVNNENQLTYGLIGGYHKESGYILIESIIDNTAIEIGNKVVTSGFSNTFPKGIMIGNVVDIQPDRYGISKVVYVNSRVNFNDIRYVSILAREEATNDN